MKSLRVSLVAALLAVPAVATAQKTKPEVAPVDDEAGTDVEMEEDAPPEDMEGVNENPDAPRLVTDEGAEAATTPKVKRTGYPIEEVLRPITLPAMTSEVGLDIRSTFDGLNSEFGLRARYGITRQIQVGLRYGIGGLYDDPTTAADDAVGFNTGKAVGLDVSYLVFDWMAARLTVPMYVDPFAMGITLGAPMKFRFGEKFAIVALEDFLDIRIIEFIPSLTDELANEANVQNSMTGTQTIASLVHLRGGVIVQMSPQLAIKGNFRQSFVGGQSDAVRQSESPTGIEGLVQYSPTPKMDVVGRAGFDALDDASGTFGLMIAAAYRI